MKKSVLVLVFSSLKSDARVKRQLHWLSKEYSVTVACLEAEPSKEFQVILLRTQKLTLFRKATSALLLFLGFFRAAYRILHPYQYVRNELKSSFDLVVANDAETLPLAFSLAGSRAHVFLDAHEYAPRQFEDRLYWRIFFKRFNMWLCRTYIPKVAGMSTVGQGLANEYAKNFNVHPRVITNAPNYQSLPVGSVSQETIRLVHHGIFNVSRHPQLMLDVMDLVDTRFRLDLYFVLPASSSAKTRLLFEEFKARAVRNPHVQVLPGIKTSEIVNTLNEKYDLGVILIPPINYNYENGMPNKLFDFIQARIGLVLGPLKEMAHICKEYNLGVVSSNFTAQAMAEKLNALTMAEVLEFKRNAEKAARALSADNNEKLFLCAIDSVLKKPTA
jgi:hypothetical protein